MRKTPVSRRWSLLFPFAYLLWSGPGFGQVPLALKDIPARVEASLPRLQAAKASAAAAGQQIAAEKRTLAPEVTLGYQANLATFNNITGMSYPGLFMPISGPPSATNALDFTPGSAATALFTWTPFTFGQRAAAVQRATAQFTLAGATYREQLFRYQYLALATCLEAVYYREIMASHRASISRYGSSLEQALVLAQTGLKPGVDTLQLQSARAQAEIDLLGSRTLYRQKLIQLSTLTGSPQRGEVIQLQDTTLGELVIDPDTAVTLSDHPAYLAAEASKNLAAAQLVETGRAWRPRLDLWGNLYGRGSGVDAEGKVNDRNGLRLTRRNIGAGFQVSMPLLGFYSLQPQKKYYQNLVKAEEHQAAQVGQELEGQVAAAREQYQAHRQIAERTALRLGSARLAYESLRISYESGLVDFTRLVQAQYDLQQAETGHAAARLMVWRSLLDLSSAKGDLGIFLQQLD